MTKQFMLAMAVATHGIFLTANPEPKGFKVSPFEQLLISGDIVSFMQWDLGCRRGLAQLPLLPGLGS